MTKYLLSFVLTTSFIETVEARNCIKYPRRCAKDLDKKRRQFTEAVIDVATLGHTQREEERRKMEKQEALAKQQRDFAQQLKQNELKTTADKLASLTDTRVGLNTNLLTLRGLRVLNRETLDIIAQTISSSKIDRAKLTQIKDLVLSQNSVLLIELERQKTGQSQDKTSVVASTIARLAEYKAEIEGFPLSANDEQVMQGLAQSLLEAAFEITAIIDANIGVLEATIDKLDKSITSEKEKLESLKK